MPGSPQVQQQCHHAMARVQPPWKGSPYGKGLYDLGKGWEAQSPLEEGEQGMMDLQHFQLQFETRLSWRWDTGAAVGLRMSSGVEEHQAGTSQDSQNIGSVFWGCACGTGADRVLSLFHPSSPS